MTDPAAQQGDLLPKVLDLLLDPVCVVDAQGRFVLVNAACERVFGYSQAELVGRNMIDLVFPEDRERTLATAAAIMRGEAQTNFENRYVRKDGRVVHLMWSARWSEADGVRLAVARDVSVLKRDERIRSTLYRISEAAHTAAGLPALAQLVHQIVGQVLPVSRFFVALYERSSGRLSFPYVFEAGEPQPEPPALVSGEPLATVLETGNSLLASTAEGDWLGVALASHNGIIGALVVQQGPEGRRYDDDDRHLLHFVSTQLADMVERKQAEARLLHMASHDALTGLPNRTLFYDRVSTALRQARRNREKIALLYVDLDGFKNVNDALGHQAGDALLRQVARRLLQSVRGSDTVARFGGDEFTVLLPRVSDAGDAREVARKIGEALGAPFDLDGRTATIAASIGTAEYPADGEAPEALLRQADRRMYEAKRAAGRR